MRDGKTQDRAATETEYEKNQSFNAVVAWLHSFRFRNVIDVFEGVAQQKPQDVLRVCDVGCAHAKLFEVLNGRFAIDYTGIEVNASLVEAARARYQVHPNFRIVHDYADNWVGELGPFDVIVALETLEHIPEHAVVRLVETIAAAKPAMFVCSVPVEIGPAIWFKNLGSLLAGYVRHKEYTWKETFWAGLYQLDKLPPHGVGHKGFDWRWLAQTIRHNMRIREIRKFPLGLAPAGLSTSVFMIAEPREPGIAGD